MKNEALLDDVLALSGQQPTTQGDLLKKELPSLDTQGSVSSFKYLHGYLWCWLLRVVGLW